MDVLRETRDCCNPICLTATQINSELLRHSSKFVLRRVYALHIDASEVCISNCLNPIVMRLVARAIV